MREKSGAKSSPKVEFMIAGKELLMRKGGGEIHRMEIDRHTLSSVFKEKPHFIRKIRESKNTGKWIEMKERKPREISSPEQREKTKEIRTIEKPKKITMTSEEKKEHQKELRRLRKMKKSLEETEIGMKTLDSTKLIDKFQKFKEEKGRLSKKEAFDQSSELIKEFDKFYAAHLWGPIFTEYYKEIKKINKESTKIEEKSPLIVSREQREGVRDELNKVWNYFDDRLLMIDSGEVVEDPDVYSILKEKKESLGKLHIEMGKATKEQLPGMIEEARKLIDKTTREFPASATGKSLLVEEPKMYGELPSGFKIVSKDDLVPSRTYFLFTGQTFRDPSANNKFWMYKDGKIITSVMSKKVFDQIRQEMSKNPATEQAIKIAPGQWIEVPSTRTSSIEIR